jgi:hypothetical protein
LMKLIQSLLLPKIEVCETSIDAIESLVRDSPTSLSYWQSRSLLLSWMISWLPEMGSTLNALNALHSSNSPQSGLALLMSSQSSGQYHSLDKVTQNKVVEIIHLVNYSLLTCVNQSLNFSEDISQFDQELRCLFHSLADGLIGLRKILSDPILIDRRKQGVELISALLLPYWFPITIPILYGTYFEIRRYIQKK